MTLHFPDVSNWQPPKLSLAGAPAVIAKATEGADFIDPNYENFKAKAEHLGIPFLAYHYLHHGDARGQARHAAAVVGAGQPLMLDVEEVWIRKDHKKIRLPDPTLADTLDFMDAWPGTVSLVYLPWWFWSGNWHSPSLSGIASRSAGLVSSNYTDYSDTGPGWEPYGGMTPVIWQYTNSHPFNGQRVDFNAYKGGAGDLRALFTGGYDMPLTNDDLAAVKSAILGDGGIQQLIYRVEALVSGRDPITGAAGQANILHQRILADATLAELKTRLDDIDKALADIKAALDAHIGGGAHA